MIMHYGWLWGKSVIFELRPSLNDIKFSSFTVVGWTATPQIKWKASKSTVWWVRGAKTPSEFSNASHHGGSDIPPSFWPPPRDQWNPWQRTPDRSSESPMATQASRASPSTSNRTSQRASPRIVEGSTWALRPSEWNGFLEREYINTINQWGILTTPTSWKVLYRVKCC